MTCKVWRREDWPLVSLPVWMYVAFILLAMAVAPASSSDSAEARERQGELSPDALAIVDGVAILKASVDAVIAQPLAEVRSYIDEARRQGLQLAINARLLDEEAARRGVEVRRVLEDEVVSTVKDPTDAEAIAYFEAHRASIQGELAQVKGEILKHLRREREAEKAKALADRLRSHARINVLVEKPGALADPLAPELALATVNEGQITAGEVDRSLGATLANASEKLYELRKEALDRRIDEILMDKEARRRRTTMHGLLTSEVQSKMRRVEEADVQRFCETQGGRFDLDCSKAGDRAKAFRHLQKVEADRCLAAFVSKLRTGAAVRVLLAPPRHPEAVLAGEDQPLLGNPRAPVTVVIFVDFQCETCAELHADLRSLIHEYAGKIKVVARDLPLETHPHAYEAAVAAEAAREQGRYWDYIAVLFEEQRALDPDSLRRYASQIGLDQRDFDEAVASQRVAEQVLADRAAALQLGLSSTPNVFVAGRRLADKSRTALVAAIKSALAEAAAP